MIAAGAWGYHKGASSARADCKAAALAAQVDDLQRALADANAAIVAGQQTRTVIQTEVQRIELQTDTSLEVVRVGWDRPVCALPERVRSELQARIDQANTSAGRL